MYCWCPSQLQPDLRRPLITSILLIGGTTHLPGFETRLHQELLHTLRNPSWLEKIRYGNNLSGVAESVAFLDDPQNGAGRVFMGNCRGWVGGAYRSFVHHLHLSFLLLP